ncbi:hypothetical protein SAY86_001704 [Trapa natans]|uniref:ZF-HD dimerization-type domain-containing protein n=1 Tax=Trapa natans TaxID=22666 RepID=A0AAN7R1T2_TRANT|nr:hypothetical protein SAY86_001704 [Trapa natans]
MDFPPNNTKTTRCLAAAHSSSHLSDPVAGYRECRKNHAVQLGRLALDGCREFMPSSLADVDSLSDKRVPGQLMCAACGCHRNFHRRECSSTASSDCRAWSPPSPKPLSPVPTSFYPPAQWMLQGPGNWSSWFPRAAVSLSDFNGDDDDEDGRFPGAVRMARRKRERTKFSKEQKEKMEAFAEQMGWKMKGEGDGEKVNKAVEEFCREIGVSRGALKIWMNNHKRKHNIQHKKVYLVDGTDDHDS